MNVPRDVQVALPPGWWGIDLHPARTSRSVDTLLDRQFQGSDDLDPVKAQLRRVLLDTAAHARRVGGMHLWLSVDAVGHVPVPASMLISALPDGAPGAGRPDEEDVLTRVHDVRRQLGQQPERVELGLGQALRVRRLQSPNDPDRTLPDLLGLLSAGAAPSAPLPSSTVVDFVVPVPGREGCVLLTFSTPGGVPAVTEALVELFDTMAATARWVR